MMPPPINGNDLNPLLQDPGQAFHPPILYLGYVGFSMAFSFAIAALIEGRVDAAWARWVQPWTLAAWLGAGTLAELAGRIRLFSVPFSESLSRIRRHRVGAPMRRPGVRLAQAVGATGA